MISAYLVLTIAIFGSLEVFVNGYQINPVRGVVTGVKLRGNSLNVGDTGSALPQIRDGTSMVARCLRLGARRSTPLREKERTSTRLMMRSADHDNGIDSIGHRKARVGMRLMMSSCDDDDDAEGYETQLEVDEEGVVYKKSKKVGIPFSRAKTDNRENIPYKTYIMMDGKPRNAELIATLRLGALTACGDILDLGDKGIYEVVRVSFVYKWNVTGFVVTGKRLYCKPARRQWAQSIESLQ